MADRMGSEGPAGYVGMRELTADMPLSCATPSTKTEANSAAAFWPEGYAGTMFGLTLGSAAMQPEFKDKPEVSPAIDDLRPWGSFKENLRMEASFSVGFLQTLLGHQPNLMMPDGFRARLSAEVYRS